MSSPPRPQPHAPLRLPPAFWHVTALIAGLADFVRRTGRLSPMRARNRMPDMSREAAQRLVAARRIGQAQAGHAQPRDGCVAAVVAVVRDRQLPARPGRDGQDPDRRQDARQVHRRRAGLAAGGQRGERAGAEQVLAAEDTDPVGDRGGQPFVGGAAADPDERRQGEHGRQRPGHGAVGGTRGRDRDDRGQHRGRQGGGALGGQAEQERDLLLLPAGVGAGGRLGWGGGDGARGHPEPRSVSPAPPDGVPGHSWWISGGESGGAAGVAGPGSGGREGWSGRWGGAGCEPGRGGCG